MGERKCSKCRFYRGKEDAGDDAGCYRYPASVYVIPDHWCGEYQPTNEAFWTAFAASIKAQE